MAKNYQALNVGQALISPLSVLSHLILTMILWDMNTIISTCVSLLWWL